MLMRFDPFRDLDRLQGALWPRVPPTAAMDAFRQGGELVVLFDLPGMDPSSIEVTVEHNVLSVRAERRAPEIPDEDVIVCERPQGTFTRQVFLGEALDTTRVRATYDQGVLEVRVPVAEEAKPRRIEIESASAAAS
jgi:HSP20 family protein